MKKSNKLFVVISIIVLIFIIGIVFAYLFLATDTFKSKQELFAKYFGQNIEVFQKITNSQTVDTYKNLENENKYEANTNIKLVHSEGGEISNPFNNLSAQFDVQKNDEEQYMYANGKIMYGDEEFFETELIKEQELYGIRFTELVKQFVSINNIEELKSGIIEETDDSENKIQELTDLKTQLMASKDKYLNIITKTIQNGIYEKSTIDEINMHSVFVDSDNVENMIIEILTNIKNEEEILETLGESQNEEFVNSIDDEIKKINEEIEVSTIKITVYEQKQKTIKTEIEIGVYKITILNTEENEKLTTKINYLDGENLQEYNIGISKKKTEKQEDYEIVIDGIEGEEEYSIYFSSILNLADEEIQHNVEVGYIQAITKSAILIENTIEIGNEFEKTQTLTAENNITLNEIDEQKRINVINYLTEAVQQNITKNVDLLKIKLGLKEEVQNPEEDYGAEMSQVEINKFNAKFEFYTGDEVSAENVKMLLDVVKNNLKNYENIQDEIAEDTGDKNKEKINIKLNIEKDNINEASANEIIEKIQKNKKYKVSIHYNETNNLIDYITINEK